MKRLRRVSLGFVIALGLIALGAGCHTFDRDEALETRVVRIRGGARYLKPYDRAVQPRTLERYSSIPTGYLIQTAADSYVTIQFGDSPKSKILQSRSSEPTGLYARLYQDTVLRLDHLAERQSCNPKNDAKQIQLFLLNGKMAVHANELMEGFSIDVGFSNGVVHVSNDCTKNGKSSFTVNHAGIVQTMVGKVRVTLSNTSHVQEIPSGYEFDSGTGLMSVVIFEQTIQSPLLKSF